MFFKNSSQLIHNQQTAKHSPSNPTNPITKHRVNTKALLKKRGWNGKWSGREELKYIKFIEENKEFLEQKETRKRNKVFLKMARIIRSRNSDQCRSHHQKLIQYHQSIDNIVIYYKAVVFMRWELILQENTQKSTKNKLSSKQCLNSNCELSISVIGTSITIEIPSESIPSYNFK